MRVLLQKQLGAFRPADDDADALLSKLKPGEFVRAEIRRPRNLGHHRKFWKLMSIVCQNQDFYKTPEAVCTAIKLHIGHTETFRYKGGIIELPKSIAFDKMDQAAFEEFYNRAVDCVVAEIIPGLNSADLKREVDELLR